MKRFFIKLAYNGTNYHGWQSQINAHSVQQELNSKLTAMLGRPVNVVGCGRTDTGVHARIFYAHFEVEALPFAEKDFVYKLNRFLPADIAVDRLFEVGSDMHARFGATSRTYRYYIHQLKDPFLGDTSFFFTNELDLVAMNHAAAVMMEFEDFTSFSKSHTQTATNLCQIKEAYWLKTGSNLVFTITADRFLRNMVRAIVGTLLEIGQGKLSTEGLRQVIASKDRSSAGFSVPAHGLFLESVTYPEDFIQEQLP